MILITIILLLQSYITFEKAILTVVVVIAAAIVLKTTVLQQLNSTNKDLISTRTTERDDAKSKIRDLEEENRILKQELRIRMDINHQDLEELRELRKKVKI